MATNIIIIYITLETIPLSRSNAHIMITTILLASLIILFAYLYHLSTKKFNYWKKRGVPYAKPIPLLGNYAGYILTKEYIGSEVQKLCKKFPNEPYFGAFYGTEPVLIPQDPEIIKLILTKDYAYFSGREITDYYHSETITENLFFSGGDRWKVLKQNLSPLFSIKKMRNMFHLIEKCSNMLEDMMDHELAESEVAEVRSLMTRYTLDAICSVSFGVDTNLMEKEESDKNNPFRIMGDMIFEISTYRALKANARAIWPGVFYGLGFENFPSEIKSFFSKLVNGICEDRQHKPTSRNDFIDLILAMKIDGKLTFAGDNIWGDKKIELEVDDDLIVALVVGFFAAGFETSSTTLSMCLYELAKNKEAQARTHEEIDEYLKKTDGKITYESITEMPYLMACMEETIRLYPVLGVITREVMADYTMPTGVVLGKGCRVHLPIYHLNRNPEWFEDPESFRPERLMQGKVRPYTFMPFGEGQRICVGYLLAKMQVISGLVTVLRKYRVSLADGTPLKLKMEPKATVTQPIGGVKLRFTKREQR
ncbi:cytochrome P450 6B2-like [Cydia pomonella]|uniref:cytochrome P450 6B2-like n=1 Tax=Cydia pomonella TaxID=82600 RepID=UPI002ADD5925|nr:cytochrome P450 6B2-like [Cydia pomonella]